VVIKAFLPKGLKEFAKNPLKPSKFGVNVMSLRKKKGYKNGIHKHKADQEVGEILN